MNPAIKRLAKELAEIGNDQDTVISAQPLQDNLFEWHFEFAGPEDSAYAEGRYHGRILFPADYPFAPPNISFLTPNGRWEVEKKICLSVTGFHPELWQPAWSIRTILLALRDHMRVDDKASIGYLDYSETDRRLLAKKSLKWKCPSCVESAQRSKEITTDASGETKPCSTVNNQLTLLTVIMAVLAVLFSYIYYHQ